MKDTLKRLQHLQRRLEALHEESARLIAESRRLVENVEQEARGLPDQAARPQTRPLSRTARKKGR